MKQVLTVVVALFSFAHLAVAGPAALPSDNQCLIALESSTLASVSNTQANGSVADAGPCLKLFQDGSFMGTGSFSWAFDNLSLQIPRSSVSDVVTELLTIQDLTIFSVSYQDNGATISASRAKQK
jgi:hypothetical protein